MSTTNALFFNTVKDIPQEFWQQLDCTKNTYYTPDFLYAYEISNSNIACKYIVIINDKQEATAFAFTQLVSIPIETITQNIKISDKFKQRINSLFCNSTQQIMFCGNIFLSGEYGTFIRKGENTNEMFHALARALKKLMKETKKLQAVFVKDFRKSSLKLTNKLIDYKFTSMKVEPNMIITLQPKWKSFDDYKAALKSKYRVKANKADRKSEDLVVKEFTSQEIEYYKSELQTLYENTIANADFNAQVLNLNTYTHLKKNYGSQFIIKGYFLENKLIGFLSAMMNQENLDAHFIGLNYSLNKEYAIYPRILNDYVRLGIKHGVTYINLGRTASEIKSTLGAKPQDLTCYIRHKKPFINSLIKPLIKSVKIKSFKEHTPFKI